MILGKINLVADKVELTVPSEVGNATFIFRNNNTHYAMDYDVYFRQPVEYYTVKMKN